MLTPGLLVERGRELLEHAGDLLPERGFPPGDRLVLWSHPSFEPWESWTVALGSGGNEGFFIRHALWDGPAYTARLRDPVVGWSVQLPEPGSLEIRDFRVPASRLAPELAAAGMLTIPPLLWRADRIGLDGTRHGISLRGSQTVRLEWWAGGPDEWRDLTAWTERMRAHLGNALTS
jgi:hypothetical protein